MRGIAFEPCGPLGPHLADGLEGCAPVQRLQVLGEFVDRHEGEDMGFGRFEVRVMEGFDGDFLDSADHALGLSGGPRVVRFGNPVRDAMRAAHAHEHMDAIEGVGETAAVARLLGNAHALIRQHCVDGAPERCQLQTESIATVLLLSGCERRLVKLNELT